MLVVNLIAPHIPSSYKLIIYLLDPLKQPCWWLGQAENADVSGWGFPLRCWHDALDFSFRYSWGLGGVGWGANNVARHLNSRDATSILPCTMGLTSRMCLARDVLGSVMGFGVVHFMLTCILDGEVCSKMMLFWYKSLLLLGNAWPKTFLGALRPDRAFLGGEV